MSYDLGFSSGADYGREDERERCVLRLRARAAEYERIGGITMRQVACELRKVADELERDS